MKYFQINVELVTSDALPHDVALRSVHGGQPRFSCYAKLCIGAFICYQQSVKSSLANVVIETFTAVYSLALSVVPMVVYFILFIVQKRRRKSQLTGYVDNWNRSKANGVTLSFGGGGTFVGKGGRTTQVGSQTGGNYETFYMSTWDWQGLMLKAYLHVIVHYQVRPRA